MTEKKATYKRGISGIDFNARCDEKTARFVVAGLDRASYARFKERCHTVDEVTVQSKLHELIDRYGKGESMGACGSVPSKSETQANDQCDVKQITFEAMVAELFESGRYIINRKDPATGRMAGRATLDDVLSAIAR